MLIGFTHLPYFPIVPSMPDTLGARGPVQLRQQGACCWGEVHQDTDTQIGKHREVPTCSA